MSDATSTVLPKVQSINQYPLGEQQLTSAPKPPTPRSSAPDSINTSPLEEFGSLNQVKPAKQTMGEKHLAFTAELIRDLRDRTKLALEATTAEEFDQAQAQLLTEVESVQLVPKQLDEAAKNEVVQADPEILKKVQIDLLKQLQLDFVSSEATIRGKLKTLNKQDPHFNSLYDAIDAITWQLKMVLVPKLNELDPPQLGQSIMPTKTDLDLKMLQLRSRDYQNSQFESLKPIVEAGMWSYAGYGDKPQPVAGFDLFLSKHSLPEKEVLTTTDPETTNTKVKEDKKEQTEGSADPKPPKGWLASMFS